MKQDGVDKGRRRILTGAATVVGGVGLAFTLTPFIKYWQPSARALAAGAPVEVDHTKLGEGQLLNVEWRGQPVFVVRRTEEQLAELENVRGRLRDPDSDVEEQQPEYARNEHRSRDPEFLVVIGVCTHLGCSPGYYPEVEAQPFDPDWRGGFFCGCHASRFDIAGRVFQGVPAPTNLVVPPYMFTEDNTIVIGEDEEGMA